MPERWWPEARTTRLIELHQLGLSARLIAEELGDGLSRNAVIGKYRRLRLGGLPKFKKLRPKPGHKPIKPQKWELPQSPLAKFNAAIPLEQRKQLLELESGMCRWPVGEPGEPGFFFCASSGCAGPYCKIHTYYALNENIQEFVGIPRRRKAA